MSVSHLGNRWFRVLRPSAIVLERGAIAAAAALTLEPEIPAVAEVEVRGAVLTGTITIVGELDGLVVQEVLTLAGPVAAGRYLAVTTQRFDRWTGYTSTGLATESPTPTITIRSVDSDGSAVHGRSLLGRARGLLDSWRGDWTTAVHGSGIKRPSVIGHDPAGWVPKRGDLYVEQVTTGTGGALQDGTIWEVVSVYDTLGAFRPEHYEVEVRERGAD